MTATAVFLPKTIGEQDVSEVAALARQLGLGIYHNGQRTALLPRDLPGWYRLGKKAANATMQQVAA